jgi:hypothetical protein
MNAIPDHHPTTSDISQFMISIGYRWSNESQIYYEYWASSPGHIFVEDAKRLYIRIIGERPFDPKLLPNSKQ